MGCSVEGFHIGFSVSLALVHADVVDDIPTEFQKLKDHDDGHAGEKAERTSKSSDEPVALCNVFGCSFTVIMTTLPFLQIKNNSIFLSLYNLLR